MGSVVTKPGSSRRYRDVTVLLVSGNRERNLARMLETRRRRARFAQGTSRSSEGRSRSSSRSCSTSPSALRRRLCNEVAGKSPRLVEPRCTTRQDARAPACDVMLFVAEPARPLATKPRTQPGAPARPTSRTLDRGSSKTPEVGLKRLALRPMTTSVESERLRARIRASAGARRRRGGKRFLGSPHRRRAHPPEPAEDMPARSRPPWPSVGRRLRNGVDGRQVAVSRKYEDGLQSACEHEGARSIRPPATSPLHPAEPRPGTRPAPPRGSSTRGRPPGHSGLRRARQPRVPVEEPDTRRLIGSRAPALEGRRRAGFDEPARQLVDDDRGRDPFGKPSSRQRGRGRRSSQGEETRPYEHDRSNTVETKLTCLSLAESRGGSSWPGRRSWRAADARFGRVRATESRGHAPGHRTTHPRRPRGHDRRAAPGLGGPDDLDDLLYPPPRSRTGSGARVRARRLRRGHRGRARRLLPRLDVQRHRPGPVIRATEDDLLRVNFANGGAHPHTIHFHGIHPANMDGVFEIVDRARSSRTSSGAKPYGIHLYHCHATPLKKHIHKGSTARSSSTRRSRGRPRRSSSW